MSALLKLVGLHQRAQRRGALIELLQWLPWSVIAAALAWHVASPYAGVTVLIVGALLLSAHLVKTYRQRDQEWLVRQLNTHDRTLEDSSDLLFADPSSLSLLQHLQKARLEGRFAALAIDLREPIPHRDLLRGWLAAALCGFALWLWHVELFIESAPTISPAAEVVQAALPQSLTATLTVTPPAYTGLAAQTIDSLDTEVAQGSRLQWSLTFARQPTAARLRFIAGDALTLSDAEGHWRAERVVEASTLYRIEIDGARALPEQPPYRIDARPDSAPQLTISEPQRTLTLLDAAAARWKLSFDAEDDYGLGSAQLLLTLAQGSGEQVTVSERRLALRGVGDARNQHFDHSISLASLGFTQGDDLIARIEVRDQRQPKANVTRSASFILRWPAKQSSDGTGVEGLVQKTLPAYFRSQRQVIIDTEALIAERLQLDADTLLARSDAIGVDQRILRLRYGQFLGEETEDAGHAGGDAPAGGDHDDEGQDGEGHEGHDHATAALGDTAEVVAEYGHSHDIAEAETLLDAGTRKLLRAALAEMWQAELNLRMGEPTAALPFENRALDYIKRVQQASRIYLARVGLELPEIDPARRLTGDGPRAGRRNDPLPSSDEISIPVQTWQALQGNTPLPLDALQFWLNSRDEPVSEPLALLQVIDELHRKPECRDCRERLAKQLWPLLTPPAAAPTLRPVTGDVGRAYLEALSARGEDP